MATELPSPGSEVPDGSLAPQPATPEPPPGCHGRLAQFEAGRRKRVIVAGHQGDDATARAGLGDAAPSVRVAALGALARMDRLRGADLELAASDPSAMVRARAAELSTALGVRQLPWLIGALSDEDTRVVEAACFALGEIGAGLVAVDDEDASPELRRAAVALGALCDSQQDALCREAATAALGRLGDPAGLPALLRRLDDKPQVRRRAVLALAVFEGPEVEAAIRRCLSDRDWQVRQAAEDVLGR